MDSMTQDETYNGYANRETWAFNLHWQNDQGLYNETLEHARHIVAQDAQEDPENPPSDRELGERVVTYWREFIADYQDMFSVPAPAVLTAWRDEVGSWWRIDYAEVGAAVRESLDAES